MKKVSIIIPSHTGAPIDDCVKSVNASTYQNIEIIIVNEGRERSVQRNVGIDIEKGEEVLCLDRDHIVHRELIENCVNLMKIYDSLYIPEIIVTKGWFGKLRNWERRFYTGTAIDCVRFVDARKCQRFDETMSGPEDSDWDRRVEGRKGISGHYLYHLDQIGLRGYLKKKAYYSKSMQRFKEKWPDDKVLNFK